MALVKLTDMSTQCDYCGETLSDGEEVVLIETGVYTCRKYDCVVTYAGEEMRLDFQAEYDDAMTDRAIAEREEDEILRGGR